jgi:cytochrome c55X
MTRVQNLFTPFYKTLFASLLVTTSVHAEIGQVRQAELLNFLEQDCGSCHGLKRTGGLGSPLTPKNLQHADDDTLAGIILNGIPETAMPPWNALISKEEVYFLIKHLRQGLK